MKPDTLPPRVREVVSCGGLRADFFEVTSNAFLYAQTQEETHVLGREYLSLAEHEALLAEAVARAREELTAAKARIEELAQDLERVRRAGNSMGIEIARQSKRAMNNEHARDCARQERDTALAELEAVKAERDRYQDAVVEMLAEAAPIEAEKEKK